MRQPHNKFSLETALQRLEIASNGRYAFKLDSYENNKSPASCKCNTCNYEWQSMFYSLTTQKTGCPKCAGKVVDFDTRYKELVESCNGRYTFEFLSFTSYRQKIPCKCNTCQHEWQGALDHLVKRKQACPKCAGRNMTAQDASVKLAKVAKDRYTFHIKEYTNKHSIVDCKCNTCGYEWQTGYLNLCYTHWQTGCPKCANNVTYTLDEVRDRLKEFGGDRCTFTIDTYKNKHSIVDCKCNICGYTWQKSYKDLRHTKECPVCASPKSKEELEIQAILGEDFKKDFIDGVEIDLISHKHKIGIEFDGIYWHREQKYGKTLHLKKTELMESKGYKLFHIFSNEWQSKKDIWVSMLKNAIHKTPRRVFARQCRIMTLTHSEQSAFCKSNHLQGSIPATIAYGLVLGNEIVSVMTFGKPRFNKNYEWELLRFCNKKDCSVIGSASKLLKHFEKENNPKSLISYGNRRWTCIFDNIYDKIRFELERIATQNYFYIVSSNKLASRNQFQKHRLAQQLKVFAPNLSEYENMLANGYDRIWDCGNLVYTKEYYG